MAEQKAETPHTVVFQYFKSRGNPGTVEPLFILRDGKPAPLPFEDGRASAEKSLRNFVRQEYPVGQLLHVFEGGRLLRGIIVDEGVSEQSGSNPVLMTGVGVRDAGVTLRGSASALATNTPFPTTLDFKRRAATAAERQQITAAARRIYKHEGLPDAVIAKMSVEQTVSYYSADRDQHLLFGSLNTTEPVTELPPEHERALFIILEKNGDGAFEVAYQNVTAGAGTEKQTEQLLDLFDIDGDGTPEAITTTRYWESLRYNVRQKHGQTWDVIYSGAADGV